MWDDLTDAADAADVRAIVEHARRAPVRCGGTVVVAIDGRSGSGKTTLAAAVGAALECQVVHLDQIYPGWEGLAAAVEVLRDTVLEPLARGEHTAYPVWDWERHQWSGRIAVAPATVLVIEGCGSSVGAAGEYAAVRVWVDAPLAVRRARGLARDGEVFEPYWDLWAAQEDAVFTADRTREKADLVIETG